MNRTFILLAAAGLIVLSACQKQQTEEERKAEVEKEVQKQLAAEHQAQQQEQLSQREADLTAREKALAESQATAASQPEPATATRSETETAEPPSSERPAASYDLFYNRLEPYGSWMETRDYGYVWQPRDASSPHWRPYTSGHWVYTEAGWTWVSQEPFGWATYHYGRWTRLRDVGWVWVPGDEWAPAWVSWRKGDDYVGWAPLPPEAQFDHHRGIQNWADNYYDIGPTQYCFVPTQQFGSVQIEQTIIPTQQNVTIINRTTNVTNISYNNVTVVNQGPSYDELRRRSEQPIPRLKLERQFAVAAGNQTDEPNVSGGVIQMVAPVVRRAQPVQRAPQVRRNISETTVNHGWADVGDDQAAREARAKMKSEATPPPDVPAKTLVRPAAAGSSPAQTPKSTVAPFPRSSMSPTGSIGAGASASAATITPTATARPSFPTVTATPGVSATATATTPMRIERPRRQTTPVPTASVTPVPTATVTQTSTPNPVRRPAALATAAPRLASPASSSEQNEPPRVGGHLQSQSKRFHPGNSEPMPSSSPGTSASPSVSPSANTGAVQSPPTSSEALRERQHPKDLRRRPRPDLPPARSGSSPATETSQTPSPTPN